MGGTCPGNAGKGFWEKNLGNIKLMYMRIHILLLCVLGTMVLNSQHRIIGFVYDTQEDPFVEVEVNLKGKQDKWVAYTDQDGMFSFTNLAKGDYHLVVVTEYGLLEKKINLKRSVELNLQKSRAIRIDDVVVSAVRAKEDAPVTSTTMHKEEIAKLTFGQDVPYLLKWTPSAVVTSDAGTGIGYTGLRIRGSDPTRINVTINGVPLNDAESHAVFWVDLPDLMSSASSVQIQRGVGSSTFGSGAFGASININTVQSRTTPYLKLHGGVGSFGTFRSAANVGSGLLANHFTLDGRISYIKSDGFIDRGSADLKSFSASAAYLGDHSTLRFNVLSGKEITYQAWNGVPVQYIDDPVRRTFNTAGTEKDGEPYDNEVDDYQQTHYQLIYQLQVAPQLHAYTTLHYTKGSGFFRAVQGVHQFWFGDVAGADSNWCGYRRPDPAQMARQ